MTLKIGFFSPHNAYDRNAFSGTVFYMRKALETLGEVRVLGGHRPVSNTLFAKVKNKLLPPPPFTLTREEQEGLDVIIAPVATSQIVQFKDMFRVPVISITDATPGFLQDFYGKPVTQAQREAEREMLQTVTRVVYSSHYMAELAGEEFPQDLQDKAKVVPFGINFDTLPTSRPQKPKLDRIELLFIGQNWERKGGDIALETFDTLRARGVEVHLTTIGAPDADGHPGVTSLGYLNKNDPTDMAQFEQALTKAHVLLFPTRADCTPMVIAEANAFGCPVVVTQTGGIASLLSPEVNGQMLPMEARGAAYADALQQICRDADSYDALSQSSFEHCHQHLTWAAWSAAMGPIIDESLSETPHV